MRVRVVSFFLASALFTVAGCARGTLPVKPSAHGPAVVHGDGREDASDVDGTRRDAEVRFEDRRHHDEEGLLPAGPCSSDSYLSERCGEPATVAIVARPSTGAPGRHERALLGDMPVAEGAGAVGDEEARAEAALEAARDLGLPAGYPFAADWGELASPRAKRRGIAIVLGLFAQRERAVAWLRLRPAVERTAEIVDLGGPPATYPADGDYVRWSAQKRVVVEVATATPAWDGVALEAIEEDERDPVRREQRRAALPAICTIAAGRVFVTNTAELYRFQRAYAPVSCGRGKRAYVPWRATRLESVVTRPKDGPPILHQVVDVSCDAATIDSRPLGTMPKAVVAFKACRS